MCIQKFKQAQTILGQQQDDMLFRALDANGDWTWGSGLANYISGDPAIALNIRTRLYCWLNDCFFDMGAGIDWLNLLGSKGKQGLLDLNCRRIILQSTGVTALNSFTINVNEARRFQGEYNIDTVFSKSYQNSVSQNLNNAINNAG